MKEKYIERLY